MHNIMWDLEVCPFSESEICLKTVEPTKTQVQDFPPEAERMY